MEKVMNNEEKIKAEVLDRLIEHLRKSTDLQNIDLMDLAGFCRNCLAKWYMEASTKNSIPIGYEDARQVIYGMSYEDWKKKYQK